MAHLRELFLTVCLAVAAFATTTALATATLLTTLTTAGLFTTTAALLAALFVTLVSLILFRHPCSPPCWCQLAILYLKSLSFLEG